MTLIRFNGTLNSDQHVMHFFVPLPQNLDLPDGWHVPIFTDITEKEPTLEHVDDSGIISKMHYSVVFRRVNHAADTKSLEAAMKLAAGYLEDSGKMSTYELSLKGHTTVAEVMCVVNEFSMNEARRVFEPAVRHVNMLIQAYYYETNEPKELIAIGKLPMTIPMIQRMILASDPSKKTFGELVLYVVNPTKNGLKGASSEILDIKKQTDILRANEAISNGLLDVFLNIRREAELEYRDGNTITAAILFEDAAEVLLRELLLLLKWEKGLSPEDASNVLLSRDINDILVQLDNVLGGNWSRSSTGPIKSWTDNVANLRDKTVHAGYRPTDKEIDKSYDAFKGLITFLSDSIVRNWQNFPLTASTIVSRQNLERRLVKKIPDFDALINELYFPTSVPVMFGRWKSEAERTLKGKKDHKGNPDRSVLLAVMYPGGEVSWWLLDAEKKLVRRAKVPMLTGTSKENFDITYKKTKGLGKPITCIIEEVKGQALSRGSVWYEAYRILPLYEIDRWPSSKALYVYHKTLL